jgi:hypothetical protein
MVIPIHRPRYIVIRADGILHHGDAGIYILPGHSLRLVQEMLTLPTYPLVSIHNMNNRNEGERHQDNNIMVCRVYFVTWLGAKTTVNS